MRVVQWFEGLRDDLRLAIRQLRSAPGFTLVAALTLALGIGANSAIFALVDAVLLRPLPVPNPDRLVMIWEQSSATPRSRVSPLNLLDWNARNRTFDAIGGFVPNVGGMVMNGADGAAETVPRQWTPAGFFDALGVKPIVGRTFLPADNDSRASVVVLNESFWRTRFNADPAVVGRDIRLDGSPYTVVGVVPDEAQLLARTSIWALVPIIPRPGMRNAYGLGAIGRLKPGVTVEAARADLTAVAAGLAREFPETNQGRGVVIQPLHDALMGSELRTTSLLFLGVVGFVLLICCANVANLLLTRATARSREFALRAALGAGRRRVFRQLLTESALLSMVGGALGLALGGALLNVAPSLIPQGLLPEAVTLGFDRRVVAFCGVSALAVGLLFGLAPAWQATVVSPSQAMASDSRSVTGRRGRMRSVLVAGEVATAVLLLFGAGLLLRTLMAVENVERGYRAERVLSMIVDPLGSRYPTPESLTQFYTEVEREVAAIPGVGGVAWASTLPMGESYFGQYFFDIVGDAPIDDRQRPAADYQIVSASYFRTLDLPVVEGRGFDDRDTASSTPICIVNEAFARAYGRGRSPIGLRVAVRPTGSPQAKPVVREIVGVARQVKGRPDETIDLLQIYVPMAQNLMDDSYLLVRPALERGEGMARAVRAAIGRVDRDQLVSIRDVMTLEDVAREATTRHRFRAVMVLTFAGLALLLAMVGVFGVLAYTVQQRVRDFGVRRALGATTGDVFRQVAGSAVRMIGGGAAAGLLLAALLGRLLTSLLFGVRPLDPTTFAVVLLVLALTAAVAAAGPAWRAARVDPARALRGE
jgi:putative ABC transport system permease protein